jgi:hypothetical protein
VTARGLVIGAIAAALTLVVASLALGGASYEPAGTRDPCQTREWEPGSGLDYIAQQLSLSALDGAACQLHVSRETLVISLANAPGREAFAHDPRLGEALRAGLERAIDDAETSGKIPSLVAAGLREVVANVPVDQLIAGLRGAGSLFSRLGVPGIPGILGG